MWIFRHMCLVHVNLPARPRIIIMVSPRLNNVPGTFAAVSGWMMCLVHLLHAGNHVTAPDGTLTCPVQGTGCRRMVGFQWLSVMCEAHESFPCARLKMRIRTVRMEGRGWRKGAYYPYDLPRHCSVSIHYFTQVKSNRDSYLSTIFFFWYIMGIQTTIFVHIMYGQVNMVLTHGTSDSSRRNRWHRRYHATQT